MTYRGAPLGGAKAHLIGTMDHSVLGTRWIYEATGDPVAVVCFMRALAGQQDQATLELYEDDELVAHPEPNVRIHRQSGSTAAPGDLQLAQVLGDKLDGAERLVATWSNCEAVVAVR